MENFVVANKNKMRLDLRLVKDGIFDSREKARIAIMEGLVYIDNQKEDKPGSMVKNDANVEYRGVKQKYVSRGGHKLEKAIEYFNIDLENKVCMDIGSSTGGFTDCMLQNGAKKVYAIDCGTNQLDYNLRIDNRVVSMENYNARYLSKNDISDDIIDFVTIDVSFISLTKILPAIIDCITEKTTIVALIKPQFEAGKNYVADGVVKDIKIHKNVITFIIKFCLDSNLEILGLTYSPIKGPKGNIEFLIYLRKHSDNSQIKNPDDFEKIVDEVVNMSHNNL